MHYFPIRCLASNPLSLPLGESLGGLNRFSHESERGKGVRQKRNHKNQTENTKRGRIMAPLSSPRSYVYFHDNEIPDRPWLESR